MATKFRKGDIVSIQGTVRFSPDEGDEHISLEIANAIGSPIWVKPEAATLVLARIEVGDKVWTYDLGYECLGELVAIRNGKAWVEIDAIMYTYAVSDLKRAES